MTTTEAEAAGLLDPSARLQGIWSPTLIDVVFGVAKEQILAEERRQSLLMGKANALLSVSGLSLTVAFTLGGLLFQRAEHSVLVLSLYVLALMSGLLAALCANLAMWIRESRTVAAADVFDSSALAAAEAADVLVPPSNGKPPESTGNGTTAYKRFLVDHYWQIYTANSAKHGTSARWIMRGQVLYVVFLILVLLVGVFLFAKLASASSS